MLPAAHRVRRERDIVQIRGRGATAASPHFRVFARATPGRSFRATVVVGKKIHKHAVVRNSLKRRTRAALAKLLPQLSGADTVVQLRSATTTAVTTYTTELRQIFSKLRLLS